MARYASNVVAQAKNWLGKKESDGSFKVIIDIYNAHKPLARGYKVKYTDHWCAAFVSAVAIKCGYTDIIPTECGCERMIDLFKAKGAWVENENCTPEAGWIIFYDWEDSGLGDNKGNSDHVGIVERVSGNTIYVIEGNYSEAVKRRTISVNGKYIRGYGVPKYDTGSQPVAEVKTPTGSVTARDYAQSFREALAGKYKVTAQDGLNIRHGAGISKEKMVAIPLGTEVQCYGYYTTCLGVKWLYIQFIYDGVIYTGFASSDYLEK